MNNPSSAPDLSPATGPGKNHVIPFTPPAWIGWSAATLFLFATLFFAAKSFNVRGDLQAALESERVVRIEATSLKNLLEAERIISRGQLERLADTERRLVEQADLSRLDVFALAPSNQADWKGGPALVVWNTEHREGLLVIAQLPALDADRNYQLWISDPGAAFPISAGVIEPTADSGAARVAFKLEHPLSGAPAFAVSVERKGGTAQPEGPQVLASN